ncbi:PAS domain-containing sensor histidine kinase [Halohasta salina]|uniref:PAS domain-containing sensor histidine kinase n=1 Tax=Halohasta salina TaxID=2961621 RepID=UPI0020A5CDC4|nr:PAS domain S-box protein [Halohasta salina]
MKETVSTVFDDLEIGITLHDPETGAIVGVNSRLESLYGYTEAEIRELSVGDYSATDEGYTQADAEARIAAAAAGEPQAFEWVIERADGQRVPVRVRLARTELDGEAYVIAEIRDISDRKQRQQTLEAERGFIEQSLETLQDVFYMLDADGRLQRWNSSFSTMTGYTDEELDGMDALDLIAAADRRRVDDAITTVLDTGSVVVEAELLTADGETIPHEFTGTRLTDTEGNLRGIVGIGRDVSARKRRLERLRKQEAAFRRLHQTASTSAPFEEKVAELLEFGRAYMDVEQGFYTRVDDDIQKIVVGVGPNEQLQTGATAPFAESYCRKTVRGDEPLVVDDAAAEGWADDPAYERFELGCYLGSTITHDGETIGTVCFADRDPQDGEFTDIQSTFVELLSEWLGYELERAERERTYRRLTERISDAYYAVDTDFEVTYWNDTMAARIGVSADDVHGENLWEYFPEVQGTVVEDRLREAMETQEPTGCEYYYEPADYWTELQIYPDEDGLAVISKDITDRKEYEARLERSNERLQEFAYILSHDLQEPLRMVSSYVDLLETELDEHLDAETREYMAFAVDGAERMRGMIDGLLQYSRVETEGEPFEPVDVEAVLEGVRQDLQFALDEADAELLADELPTVRGDADQLGQLFQNLVSNAIEHGSMSNRSETGDVHRSDAPVSQSESGGDSDNAIEHGGSTIEITATETAGGHRFAVSDDGPGIPADQQDELFGLFDKGPNSDGTGIGLAICERIVTRHDGEIWVESTEGEGSTFYFTLDAA